MKIWDVIKDLQENKNHTYKILNFEDVKKDHYKHVSCDTVVNYEGRICYKQNCDTIKLGYAIMNLCEFEKIEPIIKVGNVVETTKGDYVILRTNLNKHPDVPMYAAELMDIHEIHYMDNDLTKLLELIEQDGEIIEIYDYE